MSYRLALIGAFFLYTAYRAATLSIVIDEAAMYRQFVAPGWWIMFQKFEATNHVLYAFLERIAIALFGNAEWVLRLPSVFSGVAFLLAADRLLRRMCGPLTAAAGLAVLAFNPLILDLASAARGYMLGLALFTWALDVLTRARRDRQLAAAGTLFALSVAANLIFAIPVIAAMLAAPLLFPAPFGERMERLAICLVLPFCAAAALLLTGPLQQVSRDHFYYGANTAAGWVWVMADNFIAHTTVHRGPFGSWRWQKIIVVCLSIPAAATIAALPLWRRLRTEFQWVSAIFVLTVAGIFSAHWLFDIRFPMDRTSLAANVLFVLATAGACSALAQTRAGKWLVSVPVAALTALVVVQCATQLDLKSFYLWNYNAATKRAMQVLRARDPGAGRVAKLVCIWNHEDGAQYYRERYRMAWLTIERFSDAPPTGGDYYLVSTEDPFPARGRVLMLDTASQAKLIAAEK